MRKALAVIFICLLFILPLVSAELTDIGILKQGECINLAQTCSNCSYVNLTSVIYPNSSINIIGKNMNKYGNDYLFNYCNTTSAGDYRYTVCGDKDGTLDCNNIKFKITPTGFPFAGNLLEVFLILLFIFVCLSSLFYLVINIIKLITQEQTIYETLMSLGSYTLLLLFYYFSSNFLMYSFMTSFSLVMIKTLWFTNGFLPFLALIITMIKKSFDKHKFIGIDELTGRKLLRYG